MGCRLVDSVVAYISRPRHASKLLREPDLLDLQEHDEAGLLVGLGVPQQAEKDAGDEAQGTPDGERVVQVADGAIEEEASVAFVCEDDVELADCGAGGPAPREGRGRGRKKARGLARSHRLAECVAARDRSMQCWRGGLQRRKCLQRQCGGRDAASAMMIRAEQKSAAGEDKHYSFVAIADSIEPVHLADRELRQRPFVPSGTEVPSCDRRSRWKYYQNPLAAMPNLFQLSQQTGLPDDAAARCCTSGLRWDLPLSGLRSCLRYCGGATDEKTPSDHQHQLVFADGWLKADSTLAEPCHLLFIPGLQGRPPMAPAFLQRFTGGNNQTPLQADLKRATESNVIEVPKDVLTLVVEATKVGEEERREIMMHLRECLAEPQGKKWRRMYAALVLIEELLKNGSPELLQETSEGRYFDLVQRLSLLEKFECTNDLRVQNMVRTKASALRSEVVPRLETAGEMPHKPAAPSSGSATSSSRVTSEPTTAGGGSTATSSSSGYTGGALYNMAKPECQMILNGVVAVGHNDDTDSDSDGGDGPKKAVAFRKAQAAALPSATGAKNASSSAAPTNPSKGNVDLLDL
eukprot:s492_g17.t3